jgi:hypothetical protein
MEISKASRRVIMRIEVLPDVPEQLAAVCDRLGMTQVAMVSHAAEWFCRQNDVIQAAILGLYPEDVRDKLPAIILKQMAAATHKSAF